MPSDAVCGFFLFFETHTLQASIDSIYLSKRCIFLVVLCLTKVDIDPVHKWLSYITSADPDARVIIVGTSEDKTDYVGTMTVIRSIFQEYKNIRGISFCVHLLTLVRLYDRLPERL